MHLLGIECVQGVKHQKRVIRNRIVAEKHLPAILSPGRHKSCTDIHWPQLVDITLADQSCLPLAQTLRAARHANAIAADVGKKILAIPVTDQAMMTGEQATGVGDDPVTADPAADHAADAVECLTGCRLTASGIAHL